jgi:hypothetical protein
LRNRSRHLTITDELVALYARAQAAWIERWESEFRDVTRHGASGRLEDGREALPSSLSLIQEFDRVSGRMPWEHSLLSPRRDDDPLRVALLARVPKSDSEAWKAYAERWWREREVASN